MDERAIDATESASSEDPSPATASTPEVVAAPPAAAAPRPASRFWQEWLRPFLVILLVVGSFRSAFADWNDVPTGSMIPTILEGDRIFVNKMAYSLRVPFTRLHLMRWSEPVRGDIIVFFSPDEDKRLVKRVVGLPGDHIELRRNQLIVNGEIARYDPVEPTGLSEDDSRRFRHVRFVEERLGAFEHPVMFSPLTNADRRSFEPLTVPEGQYFVMGDNRDQSRDSRYFGTVDRDLIVGRAKAVAFSLDRGKRYRPRWDRTFRGLD